MKKSKSLPPYKDGVTLTRFEDWDNLRTEYKITISHRDLERAEGNQFIETARAVFQNSGKISDFLFLLSEEVKAIEEMYEKYKRKKKRSV